MARGWRRYAAAISHCLGLVYAFAELEFAVAIQRAAGPWRADLRKIAILMTEANTTPSTTRTASKRSIKQGVAVNGTSSVQAAA